VVYCPPCTNLSRP